MQVSVCCLLQSPQKKENAKTLNMVSYLENCGNVWHRFIFGPFLFIAKLSWGQTYGAKVSSAEAAV